MTQFRMWLIVVLVIIGGSFGVVSAREHYDQKRTMIEYCTSLPAYSYHLEVVLTDPGETQSDWLTHLPSPCNSMAYFNGLALDRTLNRIWPEPNN